MGQQRMTQTITLNNFNRKFGQLVAGFSSRSVK